MDVVSILLLITLVLFTSLSTNNASNGLCTPSKCNNHPHTPSPEIRPPFRLQGIHPPHCGLPGFALSCNNDNATIIHFPGYGDLLVKSISYDARWVDLIDPNKCVHEVFLNLNVSTTPFRSYYKLKEFTYLNCSEGIGGSFVEVPCLSGFRRHVYVVERFLVVPNFCKVVRVVMIPFSYSPFLSDGSFGLRLTWGPMDRMILQLGGSITMVIGILMVGVKIYKHVEEKKSKGRLEKSEVKWAMLGQES